MNNIHESTFTNNNTSRLKCGLWTDALIATQKVSLASCQVVKNVQYFKLFSHYKDRGILLTSDTYLRPYIMAIYMLYILD